MHAGSCPADGAVGVVVHVNKACVLESRGAAVWHAAKWRMSREGIADGTGRGWVHVASCEKCVVQNQPHRLVRGGALWLMPAWV